MKETKKLILSRAEYEEPKIDIVLFARVNTDTTSDVGDENGGEWDPMG